MDDPKEPHLWARPLTPEFAADFFRLHDAPECQGCFCMYWHFPGDNEAWRKAAPAENRAAKARRIAENGDTGMILFEDETPVGWLQIGLRKSLPKILEKIKPPAGPDGLWSITCFQILPSHRRQGNARALLAIALEHLQRMGVKEVEAYPRAGTHDDGEVWTGPEKLFLDAGFRRVGGSGEWPVVRKSI
jgi:GNAT superfamily N-acetyltransferase